MPDTSTINSLISQAPQIIMQLGILYGVIKTAQLARVGVDVTKDNVTATEKVIAGNAAVFEKVDGNLSALNEKHDQALRDNAELRLALADVRKLLAFSTEQQALAIATANGEKAQRDATAAAVVAAVHATEAKAAEAQPAGPAVSDVVAIHVDDVSSKKE